ncbi:MAG: molybdopterin molybdenumtransferase MoeA [Caldilineae bacterium]|nr:MAG: molybdopterin molybdenumtransferase MoeA [Caldilineae bacterium]
MPVESPYPLVSIDHALNTILAHSPLLDEETVPLEEALGRVLCQDVVAAMPVPPFPASAKDGYAIIADDPSPVRKLVGEQTAGRVGDLRVVPGTAVQIMTGAAIPEGADAVVMIEYTSRRDDEVIIEQKVPVGNEIRPVGQDIEQGQKVLDRGTTLGPAEIGLLAAVGLDRAPVYRQPRVALFSTGDELCEPGQPLAPGQIYDSNRFSLAAAVTQSGGIPHTIGVVDDTPQALEQALAEALEVGDVVLTSGGVSMGKLDLLKPLLEAHGRVHFGRVVMKPGKPVTFATVGETPVFALPGFPVSALVSFELFVRPALRHMQGDPAWRRPRLHVKLAHALHHDAHRTEYQRAAIEVREGEFYARTTGYQGSGRLLSMVGAHALLELPPGDDYLPAGATVTAILLQPIGTL